jgi:hypothetical protein
MTPEALETALEVVTEVVTVTEATA